MNRLFLKKIPEISSFKDISHFFTVSTPISYKTGIHPVSYRLDKEIISSREITFKKHPLLDQHIEILNQKILIIYSNPADTLDIVQQYTVSIDSVPADQHSFIHYLHNLNTTTPWFNNGDVEFNGNIFPFGTPQHPATLTVDGIKLVETPFSVTPGTHRIEHRYSLKRDQIPLLIYQSRQVDLQLIYHIDQRDFFPEDPENSDIYRKVISGIEKRPKITQKDQTLTFSWQFPNSYVLMNAFKNNTLTLYPSIKIDPLKKLLFTLIPPLLTLFALWLIFTLNAATILYLYRLLPEAVVDLITAPFSLFASLLIPIIYEFSFSFFRDLGSRGIFYIPTIFAHTPFFTHNFSLMAYLKHNYLIILLPLYIPLLYRSISHKKGTKEIETPGLAVESIPDPTPESTL